MEKGEAEGKTLLDAMRVEDNEGMQHFDGDIEKLIRAGTIDPETGSGYATNPGNLSGTRRFYSATRPRSRQTIETLRI